MDVVEIKDLEDGGAIITFELTEEEMNIYFRVGFDRFIKDFLPEFNVLVTDPSNYPKDTLEKCSSSEITTELYRAVIKYGLERTLVDHVEKLKDQDNQGD